MTAAAIILGLVAAVIALAWAKGRDSTAAAATRATDKALKTRTEVDHVVQEAAAGGSAGLADLARSSGLVRPSDK